MLFSNSLAGFIQKPVGKNLDNELNDILKTKQNFARDGRYNKPVENGYIDKELDTAIWNFQRDNDLKADGYMKPGGETERTLLQTLRWRENKGIDLKAEDPGQKNTGMENVSAAALPALAYRLAPLLGMSAAAAWAWYQNLSHSEKQGQFATSRRQKFMPPA